MSLMYPLPQKFKFNSTTTIFSAAFGVPTPGFYDFNVAANVINLFEMQRNVVYYLERMSLGGNISEENYLNSIAVLPQLSFESSLTGEKLFMQSLPVVKFYDDRQATSFIYSDKQNDFLVLRFTGVLKQIPATIGLASIDINLTLSIYEIKDKDFNIAFRDVVHNQLNRGLR